MLVILDDRGGVPLCDVAVEGGGAVEHGEPYCVTFEVSQSRGWSKEVASLNMVVMSVTEEASHFVMLPLKAAAPLNMLVVCR